MDLNQLAVIDWELGKKLAGNRLDVAEELIDLLVPTLPEEIRQIQISHLAKNYNEMVKRVHKLHGALCYCGLPRLKNVIAQLETQLKNNIMSSLPSLLDQLHIEVTLLLKQYTYPTLDSRNGSAA